MNILFSRFCLLSLSLMSILTQPAFLFAQSTKPNFIIILADDVSFDDFGCYGHPHIRTPHIDALAAEGMRFDNAYLTVSQCSPTRCSLITGRYPHNTGAAELHTPLRSDSVLFPQFLKDAGYYTVHDGKNHYGNNKALAKAFDVLSTNHDKSDDGKEEKWIPLLQARPKDKPFFFFLNPVDAHLPFTPDPLAKPHEPQDAVIPPYFVDDLDTRRDLAQYYDEIQRMDRFIGLLVDELKAQHVFENTFLLFMGDNGRPFSRCKTRLLESGIKTPFVISWPNGISSKPQVTRSLVSAIDIAPTILELAGITIPPSVQGRSFVPVLNQTTNTIRDFAFAEHNWHALAGYERAVRFGDYLYLENRLPQLDAHPNVEVIKYQCGHILSLIAGWKAGNLSPAQADVFIMPRPSEELFFIPDDPHQIHNVIDLPAHQSALTQAHHALKQWQEQTADDFPGFEHLTPDNTPRWYQTALPDDAKWKRGQMPGAELKAWEIDHPGPIRYDDVTLTPDS